MLGLVGISYWMFKSFFPYQSVCVNVALSTRVNVNM